MNPLPSLPPGDPVPLAQALIRCASVTPADAGAQELLAAVLQPLGFTVTRLRFGDIANLFARIGTEGPHFCFAGHTDVVPAGAGWNADPFAGEVRDGVLYGRGACDMKGAVAAFVSACAGHLQSGPPRGSRAARAAPPCSLPRTPTAPPARRKRRRGISCPPAPARRRP